MWVFLGTSRPNMPSDPVPLDKPTSERTEEELERAFAAYVQSKTVGGRFCPTPELGRGDDDGVHD